MKKEEEIFRFECSRQSDGVDVGHTPEHREYVDDHMEDENLDRIRDVFWGQENYRRESVQQNDKDVVSFLLTLHCNGHLSRSV